MSARRRYRVFATGIALVGVALSLAGFFAARSPAAARLAGTSHGALALVIGLWFTALAVLVVRYYGRRSAELAGAYDDLHRATLQRERSEAALQESERFIRATLDAMEAMIAVLDGDGVVLTINRAWRGCPDALVGRAGACDVGANYLTLCESAPGERAIDGRRIAAGIREVMAGTRDAFVHQGRIANAEHWMLTHVTRFPGHGPLRLVVAHQDATSLELSHRAVEQEQERFETLAAAAPVGVFRADPEGRLTYANARLAAIVGVPVEDAGTVWMDRVHPDDRHGVVGRWRQMVADVRSDEWPCRVVARDGTVRACLVRASLVRDRAGRADGFVGTIVDLTEARQTDDAYRALTLAPALEGDACFETLTRALTTVLGVDHAFVAAIADDDPGHARTIAAATDGARARRVDFSLAGTPAAGVLAAASACTYPSDVQRAFPDDPWLREHDVAAYGGVALRDADAQPIGLLVVASRTAFASPAHVESILSLFGMRMATELERRRGEETLRESELRFRTLAESVPIGVFLHDARGACLYANPAWNEIAGLAAGEGLGAGWTRVVHPDDAPRVHDAWQTCLARAEPCDLEHRVRTPSGDVRWVHVRATPLLGGLVGSVVDVTRRRAAQQQTDALNTELTQRVAERTRERDRFFTVARDLLCVANATHFTMVNPAFTEVLGYSAEELVGRPYLDFVHPDDREATRAEMDRLVPGQRAMQFENRCRHHDGSWRSLSWMALAESADVVFASARDVTELRRAEEELERSAGELRDLDADRRRAAERVAALNEALAMRGVELEKANRDLESLSHAVSHELRAPLRAIDGFARILSEERGDQLDAGGRQHLGIIRENAGRMARLVDAVLDLSRLGRQPFFSSAYVDMTALARAVVEEVRRQHPDREVAATVDSLAPAAGDATQLRQVLVNLVGNAFKYTGKVAHPCVDVGSVEHEGQTVYYVRDNGTGFDMRYADRLFRVFQRLHAPGEFDGTGMGLALVQRVIERHAGRVWAESRVGEGATFFFTVGSEPAPDAPVENPSAA